MQDNDSVFTWTSEFEEVQQSGASPGDVLLTGEHNTKAVWLSVQEEAAEFEVPDPVP